MEFNLELIESATLELLKALGENTDREGLQETPKRVAKLYAELLKGSLLTNQQIAELTGKTFEQGGSSDNMVLVKNIECFSMCEHHLALIYDMNISVAYYPNGRVIGLSKIARIAELVCARLQIQERIGEDIAEILSTILQTNDIAVIINAKHSCMCARGIKAKNAYTTTKTTRGRFNDIDEQIALIANI